MWSWLAENWGSLLVGCVLLAIVAAVVIRMVRDKKSGKGGCGCNCAGCPSAGMCQGASKNA